MTLLSALQLVNDKQLEGSTSKGMDSGDITPIHCITGMDSGGLTSIQLLVSKGTSILYNCALPVVLNVCYNHLAFL